MDLNAIQTELRRRGLHGWLFYDHHHRDPIAYRILGLNANGLVSRRWFYLVPAEGTPRKLVHRIESAQLDSLPGERAAYSTWQELDSGLRALLAPLGMAPRLAMQYSTNGMIASIALADAGIVERLRGFGADIVTAGDLISRFDAVWNDAMRASHRAAGEIVDAAISGAFREIRRRLDTGARWSEYDVQQWLIERLLAGGLAPDEPPIVGFNAHSGDPHYAPQPATAAVVGEGDLVLLDVWGKLPGSETVYYDVTWMGCCLPAGRPLPRAYGETFALVRTARDAAITLVEEATAEGRPLRGFEVDRAARGVIAAAGLGAFFVHRTGHSIAAEIHATGANMDDFETHDEREILPGSGFSIEPGVYRAEFGVRSEINMYIRPAPGAPERAAAAEVTGPRQREIVRI